MPLSHQDIEAKVHAYLAAFAIALSLRMVTLDRGMVQDQGLEVELLSGHERSI